MLLQSLNHKLGEQVFVAQVSAKHQMNGGAVYPRESLEEDQVLVGEG